MNEENRNLPAHRIILGDVRDSLATLPADYFHCCITSPPYFALRSYLPKDHPDKGREIGSEPTPEAFLATMVEVFRGVRRVLRPDGVLFVNLGDNYATGGGQMLMPHRFAMSLQSDGWLLRSTIIWHKRSPMPESLSGWRWRRCRKKTKAGQSHGEDFEGAHGATGDGNGRPHGVCEKWSAEWQDCPGCPKCEANGGYILRRGSWRPTTGHEYIFIFAKSADYFCDGDGAAESAESADCGRESKKRGDFKGKSEEAGKEPFRKISATRNPRTVWALSTEPTKEKHFASYPSELVRRCLLPGTSAGGCCEACGAPRAPVVETTREPTRPGLNAKISEVKEADLGDRGDSLNLDPERHVSKTTITGYRATCACDAATVPCRVLEPFCGTGTTLQVAKHYGRESVGCELNPAYVEIAEEKIAKPPRCLIKEREEAARRDRKKQRTERIAARVAPIPGAFDLQSSRIVLPLFTMDANGDRKGDSA